MVKIHVDSCNYLLSLIRGCPKNFLKGYDVIFEEWKTISGTGQGQVEVSVSISPLLERMTREVNM